MSANFLPSRETYTNMGYFRYWCHKVLPLVYDDSLSYYELLCKVVNYLNEVMKNLDTMEANVDALYTAYNKLQDYVNHYFDNLDVQDEINNKLDQMFADGLLESIMRNAPREIKGTVTLDIFDGKSLQSCCYVGLNRMVVYGADLNSNTGKLMCFDMVNKNKIWQYNLECYHGNSMSFNREKNLLYINACYSYNATSQLLPTVFEIDLTNPSSIKRTLTADLPIYSIAYDNVHNTFMGLTSKGTTAGEANALYFFDEQREGYLDSYAVTFLENFPAVTHATSVQGVQLIEDGLAYNVTYHGFPSIQGYNPDSGKLIVNVAVEEYFNKYRYRGEIQDLTYDWDNNEYYLLSIFSNDGLSGTRAGYIAKIGLYHNVSERTIFSSNYSVYIGDSGNIMNLKVYMGRNRIRPCANGEDFNTIMDAINYAKCCGLPAYIDVDTTDIGSFKYGGYITGFCGRIKFDSKTPIYALEVKNSKLTIYNGNFNATGYMTSSGYTAMLIAHDSEIHLDNCSFSNNTGRTSMVVANRSNVFVETDIQYNANTMNTFITLLNGSSVHYDYLAEAGVSFDGNTYPYIGNRIPLHHGEITSTPTNLTSSITPRPSQAHVEIDLIASGNIYCGDGTWQNDKITGTVMLLNKLVFVEYEISNGKISLGYVKSYYVNNSGGNTAGSLVDETDTQSYNTRIYLIP